MRNLILKARDLATLHHARLHLYNAARSPAINHIREVATWVEEYGGTENMIVAAWLHDIVEDTEITLKIIDELFGPDVAMLVDGLTDPPDFKDLPLKQRKAMQAERLKEKDDRVKIIKICDQLSNILRVTNDPPTDWDHETNFEYICGARQVTQVCRGISKELDKLFDDAYKKACQKYGRQR